jgi:hypothetical protein
MNPDNATKRAAMRAMSVMFSPRCFGQKRKLVERLAEQALGGLPPHPAAVEPAMGAVHHPPAVEITEAKIRYECGFFGKAGLLVGQMAYR